jgi:iron complex transport system substrate-binding protein
MRKYALRTWMTSVWIGLALDRPACNLKGLNAEKLIESQKLEHLDRIQREAGCSRAVRHDMCLGQCGRASMTWIAAAIRVGTKQAVCAVVVALLWISSSAAAAQQRDLPPPKRIVSINACTDQLLFALADRSQIAALTNYSVRDDYSIYANEILASGIKLIQGNAEEVLKLKPDLVLAGTYTRRATRDLLKRQALRIELFDAAGSVDETKNVIRKAASLFGHEARGEALIHRIDLALSAAANFKARGLSALQFQRRGFVSGPETLIGDLLTRLGVANAASKLGIGRVKRASLETALKARADVLVLFDPFRSASDQGAAMLLHPALSAIYPPERRVILPGRLMICAGPALPAAIAELSKSLRHMFPRSQAR